MVGPSGASLRYCDVLRRRHCSRERLYRDLFDIYRRHRPAGVINRLIGPALGRRADIVWGVSQGGAGLGQRGPKIRQAFLVAVCLLTCVGEGIRRQSTTAISTEGPLRLGVATTVRKSVRVRLLGLK